MPAGLLATVPAPLPLVVTVSVTGASVNVALTVVIALTVTVQPPGPEQVPPQPAKVEPAAGVAVSVSCAPGATDSLQSVPQLMPAGTLDTTPVPVPVFVTERVTGVTLNVAVTAVAALTVTAQLPVPEQAPPQPMKVEPAAGVAVSVNAVPGVTVSVQSTPQLIPDGVLPTVPEPVPLVVTVSVTGVSVNVAVTVVAALTVTAQLPVPEQAPPQPMKVEPAAGVAVRVKGVPGATDSLQSVPHAIPAGALDTVPAPVPLLMTVRVTGIRLKVAVTAVVAFTGTMQLPVPEQAPLQPAKVEPAAGVAVSVSVVPDSTVSLQSVPHAIPAGVLDTEPAPVPLFVTVSVTGGGVELNVAVTDVAALTVTVQPTVPVQAPPQPRKVEPAAGVAVSVN
jgi:hypothetical protein